MIKNAIISHTTRIKVPFHDVDMMHIAWHGHYVKYFEVARCELLDKIDYNYLQMCQSGYMWPVIDMHLRYVKPAQFGQEILVEAAVVEYENRLKINYLIHCADTGTKLTKGSTVQVALRMSDNEMLLATPTILHEKLGVAQ
ncbi:MAG: acyl-CoA thioesterase [Ketobacteraceae bacterium]|nr:acyl-CoA thioesterase [Ketobacteraceae bacterium]